MDKADIEALKARVNILSIIERDLPLKRKGKLYFGLCPFHQEKTPSFAVNPEKGFYHCFGCDEKGDHLTYLQKVKGLTFQEALRELADMAGVAINIKGGPRFARTTRAPSLTPRMPAPILEDPPLPNDTYQQHAWKFVAWAHQQLKNHPDAWKYLASRGISMDAINRHHLGWNPGKNGKGLYRDRAAWGLPVTDRKSLYLPIGHTIPATRDGVLVRVRIRQKSGDPRYFIVVGAGPHFLLIPPARNQEREGPPFRAVVIVESELDAILCADVQGAAWVVATGSAFAKPDKGLHERLKTAKHILIALDNDTAGQKAAKWWLETYPRARMLPIPRGKDPGEAYQHGVDIKEWILSALPDLYRTHQKPRKEGPVLLTQEIRELGRLLRENHNIIVISEKGDVAVCRRDYSPVRGRIAELVYAVPAVTEYLKNHPERIIDGGNYVY